MPISATLQGQTPARPLGTAGAAWRGLLLLALVLACGLGVAPLSGAAARLGLRGWALWPRPACRAALALLRVRVVARGAVPPSGPRLIAANHVSWLDILAVSSVEPVAFLAKSEVAAWPLIGGIAAAQRTVFVERRRRRCIPGVNRAIAGRLVEGHSLLLFPEGTTHDGTAIGPFRTSHFAALAEGPKAGRAGHGHAVQSLAIRYGDPRAAWIGDAALVPHLWAVLTGPPMAVELTYGPLRAVPHGFDRKALGRALRDEVVRAVAGTAPMAGSGGSALPEAGVDPIGS